MLSAWTPFGAGPQCEQPCRRSGHAHGGLGELAGAEHANGGHGARIERAAQQLLGGVRRP